MIRSAVILAGGAGTRLKSLVKDRPKPMAEVNGQPFLNYQLRYLKHFGIQKIYLSVGYMAKTIQDYYGDSYLGIELIYVYEKSALGTGGGIRLALETCSEKEVFVLNGDSYFDLDLLQFCSAHSKSGATHSIALRQMHDAARYGTIELNSDGRVINFREKSSQKRAGFINAGIYILNRINFLSNTEALKKFSIEKDYFEKVLKTVCIQGFVSNGYFIDIGVPEDYLKAQHDFKGFAY